MNSKWKSRYAWISRLLDLDFSADFLASKYLSERIEMSIDDLPSIGKRAIVLGTGPSLEEFRGGKGKIVASDGSAKFLMERGRVPDLVITDLDGLTPRFIRSLFEKGSEIVIHAHGDNLNRIKDLSKEIDLSNFFGTTQVLEMGNLFNPGGFTDGDRAFLISLESGAEIIEMFGMDFGSIVGKYSKPWIRRETRASERKMKKLKIAKKIINDNLWRAKSVHFRRSR